MSAAALDAGRRANLALWRERLAGGERRLGWKLGYTVPAAWESLGLDGPVVGFLTAETLVEPGAVHALDGAAAPVVEPEVAITVGEDGAIAALGPALEVVDIDASVRDPEPVLAGNVWHRAVILGPTRPGGEPPPGEVRVRDRTGALPTAASLRESVDRVARWLAAEGEALAPGDVVIAGTLVPPVPVAAGETLVVDFGPLGRIEQAFA